MKTTERFWVIDLTAHHRYGPYPTIPIARKVRNKVHKSWAGLLLGPGINVMIAEEKANPEVLDDYTFTTLNRLV